MQPTTHLFLALLGLPLAVSAAAVPAVPSPPHGPNGETAVTNWLPKPDGIDDAPHPDEVVNPSVDFGGASLEKREQCAIRIRWESNWDEFGRRYRVNAQAIPDPASSNAWNSWRMAEDWALRCRSMPHTNWPNNPAAWQDANDPARATCDVSFVHGSTGYDQYKWWHQGTVDSWARAYPGCIVDMQI
ncbi:hypothetical protein CGRA01v4_00139 [Colletotrichum graminicola]|uniref:Secreted protein n=1 Tax=Colletotrichum graminicola (strain M1.001 / M2 / FGSC 10212) TaxID=645133 RepID=E3QUA0_COLGM|nr:uncharacterized protein GLRG_09582 [Colletotrichum graminicola M1.001]EFQ34438.1 hypothetical protein GLRG_09582 [Colletotrichum graminicola M1.001]WDK08861.1 hypothetical protein CGRA01v4_00139 [Colletotrichum graminicola]